MSKRALFIGFEGCEQSKKACDFLSMCGFDTTPAWTENKRGARLPLHVKEWSGDYLFHLKSYCILRQRLLDRVKIASINFHPCHPKYPGAGGINWGLLNEDRETAITVHHMNNKVDNGKIIKVYMIPIFKNDSVASLLTRVHEKQLQSFYDIAGSITNYGPGVLLKMARESSIEEWGNHTGRMKEIDELEVIEHDIAKEDLEKLIRATHIGHFGPKLILHGYEFRYRGVYK